MKFEAAAHSLNMELDLDLQSLFGLLWYRSTHWLRPRNSPPSSSIWARITRALLVSRDRRHLSVTLCCCSIHGFSSQVTEELAGPEGPFYSIY